MHIVPFFFCDFLCYVWFILRARYWEGASTTPEPKAPVSVGGICLLAVAELTENTSTVVFLSYSA